MTRAESTETSRRKEAQMIKDYRGSLYGNYRQVKFTDVYEDVDTFLEDYKNNGFPTIISEILCVLRAMPEDIQELQTSASLVAPGTAIISTIWILPEIYSISIMAKTF